LTFVVDGTSLGGTKYPQTCAAITEAADALSVIVPPGAIANPGSSDTGWAARTCVATE
jgi:hypothetical protein